MISKEVVEATSPEFGLRETEPTVIANCGNCNNQVVFVLPELVPTTLNKVVYMEICPSCNTINTLTYQ